MAEKLIPPLKTMPSLAHRVFEKFKRIFFPLRRYGYLLLVIDRNHCRNIMEIGTWTGKRSLEMIERAKRYNDAKDISFYGFDLFELLTDKLNKEEFSKKPTTMAEVEERLRKAGAQIHLYKGFTKDTLPQAVKDLPKMDLIFIDGGHKVETIQNDWKYARELMHDETVVVFDDYYHKHDNVGCKTVVEAIDPSKYNVQILKPRDRVVTPWRRILEINFVRVIKRLE